MKKWFNEDYQFTITVLSIKPDNKTENHCRNRHEVGDTFTCQYGCSAEFCSKSMAKLFPLIEAVRSEGDLRNLGGSDRHTMEFDCPDGVVRFKVEAKSISDNNFHTGGFYKEIGEQKDETMRSMYYNQQCTTACGVLCHGAAGAAERGRQSLRI